MMKTFKSEIEPLLKDGTSFGKIKPQSLVKSAEEIGSKLSVNGPKNHQLRRFYDAVKQIERHTLNLNPDAELPDQHMAQLLFLRPHLANARRKDPKIEELREALDPCLTPKVLAKKADLTRFVKFFEAIVAYTR